MIEKVSVIIPTYNREKTIVRAIQSVLDQTYTNIEVLVIDDGSTDGTTDIVTSIADDRVKYVVLGHNGGPSRARNIGVEMAEGEWIAFQDSDDCWHKDKLQIQMEYAKEHPEYSMVYCMYNAIMHDGGQFIAPMEPRPDIMEGELRKILLVRNIIGTPTILVKREYFLNIGGFDTSYTSLEDWEFVLRFAKDYLIGYIPRPLLDCYVSDSGVSANIGAMFESRCKMLKQYKKEMRQEGVLDLVMCDILLRAQKYGVSDMVEKMMMMYLMQ